MSRNVDKANSVLVRFQELEAEKAGGYKDYSRYKRPSKISSVKDSSEAQQWRRQVIHDINSRLTRMHDPSLNELQLRELNDELNDLFAEKGRWERHIHRTLKGPSFSRDNALKFTGTNIKGRRYFGRALDLPEVRELARVDLERRTKLQTNRQREKILHDKVRTWKKTLDPEYYGFLPNEHLTFERPLEINSNTIHQILTPKPFQKSAFNDYEEDKSLQLKSELGSQESVISPSIIIPEFETIPDQKDLEIWLVERRKLQLQKQLGL
ncbi:LANO_0F14730g1_1 [Lachancea nothofagi CBS 11611]|uniref:Pre-mRNA-splicing factor ISY1 n=1 Tax=Lachancea nothofagi CBS 11611 TaxID=1266666 RepID=A0A1G4KCD4_9SACH|nr:LANO_0F14730g1_1 [Lachancea nothofagi CBS 11611]